MIRYLIQIIKRFLAIRKVELKDGDSLFLFHKNVYISVKKDSKIVIKNGHVQIGYPLPNVPTFSSNIFSNIYLGKNSSIVFNGPVAIAPGCTIRVKDNATLTFEGKNHIAHNLTLICSKEMKIGENAALSWNITLIDDDEHYFQDKKGRKIKGRYKPLIIENNVGIQMNTLIPRGITVGQNSVIACGTIVRQDIPKNSLAYHDSKLRIREGFHSPT